MNKPQLRGFIFLCLGFKKHNLNDLYKTNGGAKMTQKIKIGIVLVSIFLIVYGAVICINNIGDMRDNGPRTTNEIVSSVVKDDDSIEPTVLPQDDGASEIYKKVPDKISIPEYKGNDFVKLNGNNPTFSDELKEYAKNNSFEYYAELDEMGRCGLTIANIGKEIMPTEPRGEIGMIKPSGWNQRKYDFVDGKYLYNRCHLIGYQLAGENANEKNLITGTRYFNTEIMLPFENLVADYVKETGNHVLYRVVPIFDGDNLLATGITMEGWSVEDNGEGICFNVFCFNIEPGVVINYANGSNHAE